MPRNSLVALTPVLSLAFLAACTGKEEPVENRAPGAPTVSIGPNAARTDDDLVAVIDVESGDEDGDSVTYGYAWSQDGVPRTDLVAATVPASETAKGEEWKVSVTPNDGEVDGDPATAEITILNSAPVVTVAFSPDAPTTDDDVVAVPTPTDADGDAVTLSYAWSVEGVAADYTFDTVPADATERGQRWRVTVTPADPEEAGLPVTAEVAIENAPPEVLTVTLSPDSPYVTDDIVATVEGHDPDADEIAYSYRWFVDASEVQNGATDTLAAGAFAKHEIISVEVTPNDGFVDGPAFVSSDVTAVNSLPTATSAAIDASTAYEATTLTCLATGFADPDGDSEGWTYAWSVGGVEVAAGSSLDGSSFDRGDVVTCTATPVDDEGAGAGVTSAGLTISDTPPVLASVDLSTYAPTENDTISVVLGAGSDADGDSLTYGYNWYVEGSSVSTSATLSANRFAKGDSIYVVVTPYDGGAFGASVTSAVATAVNTPPAVTSVALSPSSVYTNSTMTASVSSSDIDGDSVSYTYDWYVDGFPRGSATSATLSGVSYFDKGQSVYVVVTPNDGEADGTDFTSSAVVVLNSTPTTPVVEITPEFPYPGDDLTCSVVTSSTDADGDALVYGFDWEVDGSAFSGAVDGPSSSLVDGADVGDDDSWTCSVVADDGAATSSIAAVTLTVASVDSDGDGYTGAGGDCDDTNPAINPGEVEDCTTAEDDNCNGIPNDQDAPGCTEYYADGDGDGYGDPAIARCRCPPPASGEVTNNDDRDDSNPGYH